MYSSNTLKKSTRNLNVLKLLSCLLVFSLAGALGLRMMNFSSAATNPNHYAYGAVDYCTLSGATTTLHGWAADPDAPKGVYPYASVKVGALAAVKAATSIAGYRDAAINAYIQKTYPGQPTPGVYGFTVSYNGLYKGGTYKVTSTALNYGAGADRAMVIAATSPVKGYSAFTGGNIPTACLSTKPATAPPPPTTVPTPPAEQDPVDTDGSDDSSSADDGGDDSGDTADTSDGGDQSDTSDDTSSGDDPAAPAPSSDANAVATVGTTTASIKVPVGNASQIHINYGTDPAKLDTSTDDQDTNGADVAVNLDSLKALTTYQYLIVRTNDDGTVVNSGVETFKTNGYTISLHFIDGSKKAVPGIKGTLSDSKKTQATSDKGGTMTFTNLPGGSYTVTYSYDGKNRTQDVNTDDADVSTSTDDASQDSTPQTAVLSDTIDLSKLDSRLGVGGGETKSSSKAGGVVLVIVILLLLAGFGFWFWRRRRNRQPATGILPAPFDPRLSNHDIIDQRMNQHFEAQKSVAPAPVQVPAIISSSVPAPVAAPIAAPLVAPTQTPAPEQPSHMGESLREMVIKSMHEEAQKKKQQGPPEA